MPLELVQRDEHLRRLDLESRDLFALLLNDRVGDDAHEREVLLDARQVILRWETSKVAHLTLDVCWLWSDENVELFTLDKIWTACHLTNEKIEEEASLSNELALRISHVSLSGNGWDVEAWPAINEELS